MSNETIAWKICYTENGQYRTVLSEHNSVGDYRAIDPMASSIALCTAPVSVEPVNWPAVEARISEFVNEYEMVGEDEQGRDGHYTPNESERALILDAMHGVLADDELMALLRPAARVAAQPDLTQQTLDDVMAGIPARDAEIEALRKEVETLKAQQPVSGADETIPRHVAATLANAIYETAQKIGIANGDYSNLSVGQCLHLLDCMAGQLSGNPGQVDQLRDAAQMIEPSGDIGDLPANITEALDLMDALLAPERGLLSVPYTSATVTAAREDLALIRAALAQQDADKEDAALAEMVHAMFRSANSIPVTRITIDRKQYEAAIDAARKEQA